jgi:hypothetical protein
MNHPPLSLEQIDYLFDFCRKRNVKEYEIKAELVDHLATSIESQWEQNVELSFFDALLKTQNDFGDNGFITIVKIKRRMYKRKYNQLFFKYLLSFFELPRIILTFSLSAVLYVIFQCLNFNQFILKQSAIIFLLFAMLVAWLYFPKKLPKVKEGNTFLIINYFHKLGSNSISVTSCYLISIDYFPKCHSIWFNLTFSFLTVFVFIIEYAFIFYMPKLLKEDFTREFPQFVKA